MLQMHSMLSSSHEDVSFLRWLLESFLICTIVEILFRKFNQLITSRHNRGPQSYITIRLIVFVNIMCPVLICTRKFILESDHDEYVKRILEFSVLYPLTMMFHILFVVVEWAKLDDVLIRYYFSSIENYFYNDYNGAPPLHLYKLNQKYDNITECGICWDDFNPDSDEKENILDCGHRFHSGCLREWELEQFNMNVYASYKCPHCREYYNWKQKWNYVYLE